MARADRRRGYARQQIMNLRDVYLKVEPFMLAAATPALTSSKARIQRSLAAQKYCRGEGAEIGAFVQSIMTPKGSKTVYIDRVPASYWADHPEFKDAKIIDPDIVDDGMQLGKIETDRFDYLIAAHMLEHADDPISALKNWTRVVKRGGHILVIVPDKRYTFDKDRALTTVEHLIHDHEHGAHHNNPDHYRETATHVMGLTDEAEIQAYVDKSEPAIHFHTWTLETFVEFLMATSRYLGGAFEIVEAKVNINEDLVVLRVTKGS